MRFLRILRLDLEVAWLGQAGGSAVALDDHIAQLGDRVLRQVHGVGTHVGDQTDGLAADVDTFIQLLRRAHRALGGEAELAVAVLLQRGRREWRAGRALALLLLDLGDLQAAARRFGDRPLGRFGSAFVAERELLDLDAIELEQAGAERGAVLFGAGVERPVFLRLERADLFLAFADQAQCRALHAAGRQARADLAPQQRRQVEADQIVECAARLLGVDQILGDIAAFLDRALHFPWRDLVEHDALDRLVLDQPLLFQMLEQVPGNRFAFAIRVGSEEQVIGALQFGNDRADVLGVLVDQLVLHLEAARDIHRAILGHEITHMAVRSEYFVVLAQILLDRLRLRRRLDDDQILAH